MKVEKKTQNFSICNRKWTANRFIFFVFSFLNRFETDSKLICNLFYIDITSIMCFLTQQYYRKHTQKPTKTNQHNKPTPTSK